ncbi:TPA: hypothetical protein NJ576_003839 [Vibrio parahaemolyticus]|jgi:hypothetical protein|nr:hypothetical protein [Vibrio vulnificus]HCG8623121.1 hypothetical protein [Vibrio parahaemolyticus]HDM8219681.1 hypothetical protein [Vibrio campbellii]
MNKEIYQFHQMIMAIKALLPERMRSTYFRHIWAISTHAFRQSSKGKQELTEFMVELRLFVQKLNDTFPVESDEVASLDSNPRYE